MSQNVVFTLEMLTSVKILVIYMKLFCFSKKKYLTYFFSVLSFRSSLLIYVPHTSSYLTCLCAFGVLLKCFTYAFCASFSRTFCALFVHGKIVFGWICSPAKTHHFPRIIKGTFNCAIFIWVKK